MSMKDILETAMKQNLNINELFSTNFSISTKGADLTKTLRRNLGFESNYEVARLAMGLSMSGGSYPESTGTGSSGTIRGGVLFDKQDYPLWVGLLLTNYLEHHPNEEQHVTMTMLQSSVRAHWDNGVHLMNNLWEQCNGDENRFWEKIITNYAELPETVDYKSAPLNNTHPSFHHSGAVRLILGNILKKNGELGEQFFHEINGSGYSPHIAIMGQAGSGKTRIKIHILTQINT